MNLKEKQVFDRYPELLKICVSYTSSLKDLCACYLEGHQFFVDLEDARMILDIHEDDFEWTYEDYEKTRSATYLEPEQYSTVKKEYWDLEEAIKGNDVDIEEYFYDNIERMIFEKL